MATRLPQVPNYHILAALGEKEGQTQQILGEHAI